MLDIKIKALTDNGLYKSYEDYNTKYFELVYTNHRTQKDYINGIYAMAMFVLDLYTVCDNWQHYYPDWYKEIELLMNDLKGKCVNHIKYLEKFISYRNEVLLDENV